MEHDARMMRGERPFIFTNLKDATGLDAVIAWLEAQMRAPHSQQPSSIADAGHGHVHR